jgi:hypothetical protein
MKLFKNKYLRILVFIFIIMNIVAFFHAYRFTHFTDDNRTKKLITYKNRTRKLSDKNNIEWSKNVSDFINITSD